MGFRESWYSWRHQLRALGAAGFHAVAPDMRGYGATERPAETDRYTLLHLVGDMVGVLDAMGVESAVIAGHDWGSSVAWQAALLRPDRFRGVILLSVPPLPRAPVPPTTLMPRNGDAIFYHLYFQAPGVAEAELGRDVPLTIRSLLYAGSAEAPQVPGAVPGMVPRTGGFLSIMGTPPPVLSWLSQADIDYYVGEFSRTGFAGGLNWYRNIDCNWELLSPFAGRTVTVPALYIAGEQDPVVAIPGVRQLIAALPGLAPQLRGTVMLPSCGHWTQQERPQEVNAAMLGFLQQLA